MKRIIICADGTWNLRDQIDKATGKRHATNVTKLARAVLPRADDGIDQIVFYHDGVGTRRGLDRITGGAFGQGMARNIRDIYRFIAYNYLPEDEIFLFGFSRGAFTVRTLVGFMNRVGLVTKGDDFCVPELYACYEHSYKPESAQWKQAFKNVRNARPCPSIRFIGVWDTVGALGAPGFLGQLLTRNRYRYHDVGLNSHVKTAVHAMAIDEHRRPFKPNLWQRPSDWNGTLVQAWFPGVHSNVGGGYSPDGLANEALHWMVGQAEQAGLALDSNYLKPFLPCFNSVLNDSMTLMYRLFGRYTRPLGRHTLDGEVLHQSAIDRLELAQCHYKPKNLVAYLREHPAPATTDTTATKRGTPCPAEAPAVPH
jgi:uncharacterized protein (DUF2235 family)